MERRRTESRPAGNLTTVGIVGITGYTGLELFRLLDGHPLVRVVRIFGRQQLGIPLRQVFPHIFSDLVIEAFSPDKLGGLDFVFLCLPHGEGQEMARQIVDSGVRVIDLSADFRLKKLAEFKEAYHSDHREPDLLREAVYGVPELFRAQIKGARLIANPGCYATSVILALYPLTSSLAKHAKIVVDAKSGVSGAGRSANQARLFSEVNEHFSAYSTFGHRHQVEIESVIDKDISFSTHLLPMNRGILSSIYILGSEMSSDSILEILRITYSESPFVTVNPDWETPGTREVTGSNRAMLTVKQDPKRDCIVIFSAIDNLIKGASGQAIQNLNIMAGFADESVGLPLQGWFV